MEQVTASLTDRVGVLYRQSPQDPSLVQVLSLVNQASDDELAEAIEVDGRTRLALKRPVHLRRYLDGVPGLPSREVALDAAIDVALRSLGAGGRPSTEAVEALKTDYPALSTAIADAALLAEFVVSTTGVSRVVRTAPRRAVPSDFGPASTEGGRRYRLTEALGAGSTGEVFLAIDRQLSEEDRPAYVAIKLIAARGRGTRSRLQLAEEATKARRVLHDQVVRVLDRGVSDEDEDYIVYEHVAGGDLDRWFENRKRIVSPEEAARLIARVGRGLHAAHAAGLLHCDLKPANILVTPSGEPKVADFGIAVRESDLAAQPSAGRAGLKPIGNVAFISPEQYRGEEGSLSVASDVYALGGILYYLLTGTLPNGSTIEEIAQTHDASAGRTTPPSARAVRPELSVDLDSIVRRAMSLRASERHASAAALADDLDAWVRREPIAWQRPSFWKVTRLAARRRPGLAATSILAAVSVLAGSAAGGYWSSVASKSRKQAATATQKVTTAKEQVLALLQIIEVLEAQGLDDQVLPMIVAIESMYGAIIFGSPELQAKLWREKVKSVRNVIAEFQEAGRGSDVEALLWETVLGFWLMHEGKYEEVIDVLAASAERWKARGLDNEGIAQQGARLLLSAKVLQMSGEDPAPGEQHRNEILPSMEAELKAALSSGIAGGLPTRTFVLRALAAIYGPSMLNNPQEQQVMQKRLTRHEELMKARSRGMFAAPKRDKTRDEGAP